MANMTFKASLLPDSNLGYSLGSSTLLWKIYGSLDTRGQDIHLTSRPDSNDSGDIVWLYGNGNEKARIWTADAYTTSSGPYYRVYKEDGTLIATTTLSLATHTHDDRYVTLSTAQTITGAKTFSQPIYFSTGGGTTRAILAYDASNLGYGITYKEGNPDVMTFSASGNANNMSNADLSINGLGNGILSHLGNYIPHTGNTTGTVGNSSSPVYVNSGKITEVLHPASGAWFRGVPIVGADGVMEIGKYIDFHASNTTTTDYDARITANTTGLTLSGTTVGSFKGDLDGNAATATKWKTARTLTIGATGKSVDGSANVSWSKAEILGSSNASYFYRGDQSWNNTLSNDFYANTITATNTTTNGSQFRMRFSDKSNGIYGLMWTSRDANKGGFISFRHYAENSSGALSGYYENYRFPSVTAGLSSNPTYYILTTKDYSTLDARYVNVTGDTMTGTLTNTASPGFTNTVSAGTWAYLRLNNGSHIWDIASRTSTLDGCLQFRPGGVGDNGPFISRGGLMYCFGEICSRGLYNSYDQFRAVYGNYGAMLRNDGSNFWILMTNSGDQYGSYNSLRPFRVNCADGTTYMAKAYGAVWNDYAEFRETKKEIEPGRCIREIGDDTLELTTERLQKGCEIVSDTFGFAIGKSDKAKTPTAATGRVLAYPYEDREKFKKHIGDPVCSGPNGTISIMTEEEARLYPWCIIGTISAVPDYEIWHAGHQANFEWEEIKVNGRIWIRIR